MKGIEALTPTHILRDEHRVILCALAVLERGAERLAAGDTLPEGWWDELLEWLRAFADSSHHAKEENVLFPAMIAAGVPSDRGPVAVMLNEHEQGRALIAAMATCPPAERAAAAGRYVRLLRAHIDKENGIVFRLADAMLAETVVQQVVRDFDVVATVLDAAASEAAVMRLARALEP